MTLKEIKAAVISGRRVFWVHEGYEVKAWRIGTPQEDWVVVCHSNGHAIGLTWRDGVTMNGREDQFFCEP